MSTLVVFADAATAFSTTDVYDVDGELVRFDTGGRLIWAATGATFSGFPAAGNFLGASRQFEVRFGLAGGAPRAFFTEVGPGTLCNLSVQGGQVVIQPTTVAVPR